MWKHCSTKLVLHLAEWHGLGEALGKMVTKNPSLIMVLFDCVFRICMQTWVLASGSAAIEPQPSPGLGAGGERSPGVSPLAEYGRHR